MMTDRDEPKFEDIDVDGDGCISEEEFQKAKDGN
tara:strand:+ start:56 stop:157 length:102 start_codon:yes stop_codon:yes gene_type:complete